jgi:hypothetical protein
MEARRVLSIAPATSIPVELNHRQKILGRVTSWFELKHPGEPECDLEIGPAIDSIQIYGRRLRVTIDFQSETRIGSSKKSLTNCHGAFAQGQRTPAVSFGDPNQPVELGFAPEYFREGQIHRSMGVDEQTECEKQPREQNNRAHRSLTLDARPQFFQKKPPRLGRSLALPGSPSYICRKRITVPKLGQ